MFYFKVSLIILTSTINLNFIGQLEKIEIFTLELDAYLHGKGFKIRYKVFGEKYCAETPVIEISENMEFNYNKIVCFDKIRKVSY